LKLSLNFCNGEIRFDLSQLIADIAAVRLPSRSQASDAFAGTKARVSGWGKPSDCKSLFY
jgi:hypothetical protein